MDQQRAGAGQEISKRSFFRSDVISQPLVYQQGLLEISKIRRPSEGWEGLAISGHPVRYKI
jgi:hypothetical protein